MASRSASSRASRPLSPGDTAAPTTSRGVTVAGGVIELEQFAHVVGGAGGARRRGSPGEELGGRGACGPGVASTTMSAARSRGTRR